MIEPEDLKIGDIIYVNFRGEQTDNLKDIPITIIDIIKSEHVKLFPKDKDKFMAYGVSKDKRAIGKGGWMSKWFIKNI